MASKEQADAVILFLVPNQMIGWWFKDANS